MLKQQHYTLTKGEIIINDPFKVLSLQGPIAPAGRTLGCKTRLDVKCALSFA